MKTFTTPGWQSIAVACSLSLAVNVWSPGAGRCQSTPVVASPSADKTTVHRNRLSQFVTPDYYDLTFEPDLKTFTFQGLAQIDLTITQPTDTIVLNALDIEIQSSSLIPIKNATEAAKPPDAETSKTGSASMNPEYEQASIKFANPISNGRYRLHIKFTGVLNDKLRGFYRSYYTDGSGTKRWLATTQMEPTDARRMFPCFDEPEMKAKFKITAVIDPDSSAISNGKIESVSLNPESGKKLVSFKPSPKMSSYLVALMIGDFKATKTQVVRGTPITVWALSGKEQMGDYALEAAGKILEYQTDYFGIAYPGEKLDLIAIPDFRSGAMENLGAVTFREANLLVDKKTASTPAKRNVFAIIAHELAHQWFGDLVTMRWWDDIWLNEAFASWMGTKTVEAIHPEWQELTRAIFTRNKSMEIDELQATRAIHADVADPKQAAEMFDSITYDKGESILWMLENYVGAKKFQAGINKYLTAHLFGNATSEDLWQSIGDCSGLPVPELMKSWVFQPGFPIVKVSTTSGGDTVSLSQERFFGMPGVKSDALIWDVPVVMRELKPASQNMEQVNLLFRKKEESVKAPAAWGGSLIANAGGRGFYRALYAQKNQETLLANFDWLTPEERLSYLSDLSALVWKGSLPVQDKLSLLPKSTSEADPLVQDKLVDWCRHPYHYLDSTEKTSYEKLMQKLLAPIKTKIGWEEKTGEPDSVRDLRRSLLTLLGTFAQDDETISEAKVMYKKYMADRQAIPADVASAVLTIVTYNGGAAEYDEIITALKTEKVPELEKRFLSSLTHFGQPELMEKTLNMVLTEEVRSQDGFRVLSGMLEGERTKHRSWQFVKDHWSEVTAKFPPRSMAVLAYACESFDKPDEEADLKSFFAAHDLPYARAAVSRMLEDVHRRVLYRKQNQEAIGAWVSAQSAQKN
ncbi:MAG: M1 family metallopeptidase [Candidatus Melainabacteria bacterium]|nr:M1 family metallopeptidase [Candidatus Melainabacteria bacterium]